MLRGGARSFMGEDLESTIVVPMAVAAISSSVLKLDPRRSGWVVDAAVERLSMPSSEFVRCVTEAKESLREILELFGFPDRNAGGILDDMMAAADHANQGEET